MLHRTARPTQYGRRMRIRGPVPAKSSLRCAGHDKSFRCASPSPLRPRCVAAAAPRLGHKRVPTRQPALPGSARNRKTAARPLARPPSALRAPRSDAPVRRVQVVPDGAGGSAPRPALVLSAPPAQGRVERRRRRRARGHGRGHARADAERRFIRGTRRRRGNLHLDDPRARSQRRHVARHGATENLRGGRRRSNGLTGGIRPGGERVPQASRGAARRHHDHSHVERIGRTASDHPFACRFRSRRAALDGRGPSFSRRPGCLEPSRHSNGATERRSEFTLPPVRRDV